MTSKKFEAKMMVMDESLCQCKAEGCMCMFHKTNDENGLCLPCSMDMHLIKIKA